MFAILFQIGLITLITGVLYAPFVYFMGIGGHLAGATSSTFVNVLIAYTAVCALNEARYPLARLAASLR